MATARSGQGAQGAPIAGRMEDATTLKLYDRADPSAGPIELVFPSGARETVLVGWTDEQIRAMPRDQVPDPIYPMGTMWVMLVHRRPTPN